MLKDTETPDRTWGAAHCGPSSAIARRFLVIYNPSAGRGRRSYLSAVLTALEREGAQVEVEKTSGPCDAERIARTCRSEVDAVIAAGGDGTVNEVINGLLARGSVPIPALGIIPIGTTNVLARDLGLRIRANTLARLLARGTPRAIYLGQANGCLFSLMCGIGFDARVVARVDLRLKRRIGKLAYVLQSLRELITYDPRQYSIIIDGTDTYPASGVVIAKSRFYGGGFQIAPRACVRKPELQVCLFTHGGRWSVALYILGVITGLVRHAPGYKVIQASRVRIAGYEGDPAQIDGDFRCVAPLEIGIYERPIDIIAP
jgi:diacylglycerol kinase (ATP)